MKALQRGYFNCGTTVVLLALNSTCVLIVGYCLHAAGLKHVQGCEVLTSGCHAGIRHSGQRSKLNHVELWAQARQAARSGSAAQPKKTLRCASHLK